MQLNFHNKINAQIPEFVYEQTEGDPLKKLNEY